MRFLVDQMIDSDVRESLRISGHDVISVSEIGMSTADDSDIMNRVINDKRILITLDEHFGDWAILPLERHPGVIRLKVHPATTENINKILFSFLEKNSGKTFENKLVIVSPQGVRWITTAPK